MLSVNVLSLVAPLFLVSGTDVSAANFFSSLTTVISISFSIAAVAKALALEFKEFTACVMMVPERRVLNGDFPATSKGMGLLDYFILASILLEAK